MEKLRSQCRSRSKILLKKNIQGKCIHRFKYGLNAALAARYSWSKTPETIWRGLIRSQCRSRSKILLKPAKPQRDLSKTVVGSQCRSRSKILLKGLTDVTSINFIWSQCRSRSKILLKLAFFGNAAGTLPPRLNAALAARYSWRNTNIKIKG